MEKHAKQGLVVLAVNAWDEQKSTLKRFAKKGQLRQTILLNGSGVAKTYKTGGGVPTSLWIDRKGVVIDAELGFHGAAKLARKTERLVSPKS